MTDFFRQIVENTADGILFTDKKGTIKFWNRGCELIFGFTANEAVGSSLDIIIPEKTRQRHWDGYFKVIETGVTVYGDKMLKVPAVNSDEEKFLIEFTVQIIKDNNEVAGISAIIRKI